TTEPRAPFSGHPRSNACSRSPLQRSHARRSQATHGPTRARGPRYKDPCSGYRFRGRRATGYNRTMSETAAGRVGVVVLLVLTAVAARVFAGSPEAPVLVLSVTVAPLLALLTPSADPAPSPNRVAGLAAAAAVGLVLCANLGAVADVARLAGVPRHAALTLS